MNKVLAIVVAYNNPILLAKCLDSLMSQTYTDIDIVVVDNSDNTESLDLCISGEPNIGYHSSGDNLFWTGGLNAGLGYLTYQHQYFLTLNQDIALAPTTVETLIREIERLPDSAYAIAPTGYGMGGQQDHIATRNSNPERVNYLIGACVMYKSKVIPEIGRFDESMKLGADDFDYSLRMREEGKSLWIYESEPIVHHAHSTGDSENWNTVGQESWNAFNAKYDGYFKDEEEAIGGLWDCVYKDKYPTGTGLSNEEKRNRGIKR